MFLKRSMVLAGVILLAAGAALAAKDTDNDGIKDRKDRCGSTMIGAKVDKTGCAVDSDADGVPDGIDRCASTPAGWQVDATGCPIDSDGDGVVDGRDTCGVTPRGATVDASGCPSDADGDGVLDGLDRCARTVPSAVVDGFGCAIDSDHDGVPDGVDQCAASVYGRPVDASGCDATPKVNFLFGPDKESVVLEGVVFDKNQVDISESSAVQLEQVARFLADYPEVSVEIRAYTDAKGAAAHNRELSLRRAEVVKSFLVAKGIEPARLKTRGLGERSPIADNKTPEGRERNRRIELARLGTTAEPGAGKAAGQAGGL